MANATLLVVDDEQLIRWSLAERLAQEGHRVLEAGTGKEALERSGDEVDLVLSTTVCPMRTASRCCGRFARLIPTSS